MAGAALASLAPRASQAWLDVTLDDFTKPAAIAQHTFTDDCPNMLHQMQRTSAQAALGCADTLERSALQRWAEIRRDWLDTHGHGAYWPDVPPRWRNGPPSKPAPWTDAT